MKNGEPGAKNPFVGVSYYRTGDEVRPTLAGKLFPSLTFYHHIRVIVQESSKLARAGRYDPDTWMGYCVRVLRALEGVGVKVSARGLENLDKVEGPVIYAANHMSTLETFVLPAILLPHGKLTYVVKQSLLDYPWFGDVLKSCEPIAVGRKNPREDLTAVMTEGADRLARGYSVVVFPQTTRTDAFDPSKFNTIGAKLAARSKVPLIPVALRTNAWSQGRFIKDMGPIRPERPVDFVFGAPILPEGKGDNAHRATVEFITGVFSGWAGGGS